MKDELKTLKPLVSYIDKKYRKNIWRGLVQMLMRLCLNYPLKGEFEVIFKKFTQVAFEDRLNLSHRSQVNYKKKEFIRLIF